MHPTHPVRPHGTGAFARLTCHLHGMPFHLTLRGWGKGEKPLIVEQLVWSSLVEPSPCFMTGPLYRWQVVPLMSIHGCAIPPWVTSMPGTLGVLAELSRSSAPSSAWKQAPVLAGRISTYSADAKALRNVLWREPSRSSAYLTCRGTMKLVRHDFGGLSKQPILYVFLASVSRLLPRI
ncbi:hypothetical protein LZ30DRAFT_15107 [Colletotrichum cereale]|nr:hypothetical protein LZ30DRAFT_15107 [Colletotrichum cereale]